MGLGRLSRGVLVVFCTRCAHVVDTSIYITFLLPSALAQLSLLTFALPCIPLNKAYSPTSITNATSSDIGPSDAPGPGAHTHRSQQPRHDSGFPHFPHNHSINPSQIHRSYIKMGAFYETIPENIYAWILQQKMLWVATAPLSKSGHINVSPKGGEYFGLIDNKTFWYMDLSGSGCETIAHLRENGRITVMFQAFEGSPRIVRLWGRGE